MVEVYKFDKKSTQVFEKVSSSLKYHSLVLTLKLALEETLRALPSLLVDHMTSRIIAKMGKNVNVRSSAGSPLACGVMCFVSSSFTSRSSVGSSVLLVMELSPYRLTAPLPFVCVT